MAKLAKVHVGKKNPVRIMGILNLSPESFNKKSIKTTKTAIKDTVKQMESDGADFIDVGGMSTAPYLPTIVSEKIELDRILKAVKIIQNTTNLPVSVDTCRSNVAYSALENGVEIINDISGLKFDSKMSQVISKFCPSLILCAYGKKTVYGNTVVATKDLLEESLFIVKKTPISLNSVVLDPAIGFFRKSGNGKFYTKIRSDWVKRDLTIIQNLPSIKGSYPILVSVSNKSFLGSILKKEIPSDRLYGSITAEAVCVLNGADVIRTHNVGATKDAITIVSKLSRSHKGL